MKTALKITRGGLRVVDDMIRLAREVGAVARAVSGHDRALTHQMRRAWTSAANNASEGQHQRGNQLGTAPSSLTTPLGRRAATPVYAPRCAEATVLHRVLSRHLGPFLEGSRTDEGRGVPSFVERVQEVHDVVDGNMTGDG
jgi:hypothetical protein